MKIPLHVLHVVPHLDRVGGNERQALTLARLQRRRSAIAPILLTHGAPGLPDFEKLPEGEVHRLPRGLRRHHPGRWWRRNAERIDLVHAHGLHKLTGQLVSLARDAGIPTLVKVATPGDVRMFAAPETWEHPLDGDDRPPGSWRWRRTVRTAFRRLRRADLFGALNEGVVAELEEHGLPWVRISNQVDTEHFRPPTPVERRAARGRLGLAERTCLIVYVGRLAERKDVGCLLQAFAMLVSGRRGDRAAEIDAKLVVVGDGPLRADLVGRAAVLGIAARVDFTGALPDVRAVLFAADVLVNPSRAEGLPNAVLEARACGLATVLSDIAGHAAAAGARTRRYPVGDAARLAALLEDLAVSRTAAAPARST